MIFPSNRRRSFPYLNPYGTLWLPHLTCHFHYCSLFIHLISPISYAIAHKKHSTKNCWINDISFFSFIHPSINLSILSFIRSSDIYWTFTIHQVSVPGKIQVWRLSVGFNNLCYCNSLHLWGKICSYHSGVLVPVVTNSCIIFQVAPSLAISNAEQGSALYTKHISSFVFSFLFLFSLSSFLFSLNFFRITYNFIATSSPFETKQSTNT